MDKYKIQENQYNFPYHYLINLQKYNNFKYLTWGLEYYSYISYTITYITNSKFTTLLDVGCGDGRLLNDLSQKLPDKHLTGVDTSKQAILLAQGLNYASKNIEFICTNIDNIIKKFDIIVLNEVLEHISDELIPQFISAVKKTIAPNGIIIITVPSKNVKVNQKHYRHYTLADIQKHFNDFDLIHKKFIFKNTLLFRLFMAIADRINCLKFMELIIGKTFIFNAKEKNCRHIFCAFKTK